MNTSDDSVIGLTNEGIRVSSELAASKGKSVSGARAIAEIDRQINEAKTTLKRLKLCRAKLVRYESILEPYLATVEKELDASQPA